jgi:uncharacterized protein (TIGR02118 family)
MAKMRILNIVGTECPRNEAKFNDWYNEVHIPLLFKYPGLKKITRYQLMGESQGQAKYLAIYEYEDTQAMEAFPQSPEFKAAIDEMRETWKDEMFDIKWAANYAPIKTWER